MAKTKNKVLSLANALAGAVGPSKKTAQAPMESDEESTETELPEPDSAAPGTPDLHALEQQLKAIHSHIKGMLGHKKPHSTTPGESE